MIKPYQPVSTILVIKMANLQLPITRVCREGVIHPHSCLYLSEKQGRSIPSFHKYLWRRHYCRPRDRRLKQSEQDSGSFLSKLYLLSILCRKSASMWGRGIYHLGLSHQIANSLVFLFSQSSRRCQTTDITQW